MPVGRGGGVNSTLRTLPSFARIIPRWQPVEINDQHLRSYGKIGDCEQSMNYTTSAFGEQLWEPKMQW